MPDPTVPISTGSSPQLMAKLDAYRINALRFTAINSFPSDVALGLDRALIDGLEAVKMAIAANPPAPVAAPIVAPVARPKTTPVFAPFSTNAVALEPTPAPTGTPTPTPAPTGTPTPSPSPTPTPAPTPTAAPAPAFVQQVLIDATLLTPSGQVGFKLPLGYPIGSIVYIPPSGVSQSEGTANELFINNNILYYKTSTGAYFSRPTDRSTAAATISASQYDSLFAAATPIVRPA